MLRIPAPLSDQYEVSLQGLGYDDIQSVCEDAGIEDFLEAGMRMGERCDLGHPSPSLPSTLPHSLIILIISLANLLN